MIKLSGPTNGFTTAPKGTHCGFTALGSNITDNVQQVVIVLAQMPGGPNNQPVMTYFFYVATTNGTVIGATQSASDFRWLGSNLVLQSTSPPS
jgi:hypothetical protein